MAAGSPCVELRRQRSTKVQFHGVCQTNAFSQPLSHASDNVCPTPCLAKTSLSSTFQAIHSRTRATLAVTTREISEITQCHLLYLTCAQLKLLPTRFLGRVVLTAYAHASNSQFNLMLRFTTGSTFQVEFCVLCTQRVRTAAQGEPGTRERTKSTFAPQANQTGNFPIASFEPGVGLTRFCQILKTRGGGRVYSLSRSVIAPHIRSVCVTRRLHLKSVWSIETLAVDEILPESFLAHFKKIFFFS